jgi:Tfp pilus assembly protein PilF
MDEAIRLNPQYADAYYGRGMVYKKLGKTKEAELDFQKAKKLGYEQ